VENEVTLTDVYHLEAEHEYEGGVMMQLELLTRNFMVFLCTVIQSIPEEWLKVGRRFSYLSRYIEMVV
jgi:hypothetical protein